MNIQEKGNLFAIKKHHQTLCHLVFHSLLNLQTNYSIAFGCVKRAASEQWPKLLTIWPNFLLWIAMKTWNIYTPLNTLFVLVLVNNSQYFAWFFLYLSDIIPVVRETWCQYMKYNQHWITYLIIKTCPLGVPTWVWVQ